MDKIKKIVIDTEKGIVSINGEDYSKVSYFRLTFNHSWELEISHCFRYNGEAFKPKDYQPPDKRAVDRYEEMLKNGAFD